MLELPYLEPCPLVLARVVALSHRDLRRFTIPAAGNERQGRVPIGRYLEDIKQKPFALNMGLRPERCFDDSDFPAANVYKSHRSKGPLVTLAVQ